MKMRFVLLVFLLLRVGHGIFQAGAQQPRLILSTIRRCAMEKRIDNLLSQMTVEEKVNCLGTNTGVPRLGVRATAAPKASMEWSSAKRMASACRYDHSVSAAAGDG